MTCNKCEWMRNRLSESAPLCQFEGENFWINSLIERKYLLDIDLLL